MDSFVLSFIPLLSHYPLLLVLVETVTFLFFGGFIFSGIWNLIFGYYVKGKK